MYKICKHGQHKLRTNVSTRIYSVSVYVCVCANTLTNLSPFVDSRSGSKSAEAKLWRCLMYELIRATLLPPREQHNRSKRHVRIVRDSRQSFRNHERKLRAPDCHHHPREEVLNNRPRSQREILSLFLAQDDRIRGAESIVVLG